MSYMALKFMFYPFFCSLIHQFRSSWRMRSQMTPPLIKIRCQKKPMTLLLNKKTYCNQAPLCLNTHTSKITKKRELKGSDIELQKLSVLKQMANVVQNTNNDSFNLFGQQIAEELRKIKDNMVQTRLKRNIMNMIYDAQESEMYTQQQHATTSHTSSKYPAVYPTYPSPSQPPAGYYTSQQPPH